MEIAIADEVPALAEGLANSNYRGGTVDRIWLLAGEGDDGLKFRLFLSKYRSGGEAFASPRHHHGFQQIRWADSGSINFGPDQNIPEGDIAYFPKGTYYGPQVKDGGVSLLLQYGFDAEMPGGSTEDYRNGELIKTLAKGTTTATGGRFADGYYIDKDPVTGEERRRDGGEVMAQATGRNLKIPPERYATPVLMHVEAFGAYQDGPGVEVRQLGSFFDNTGPEGDLAIRHVKLTDGTYRLTSDRAQIAWTTSSGLQIDGKTCPRMTSLYSPLGEEALLSGADGAKMFVLELPRRI